MKILVIGAGRMGLLGLFSEEEIDVDGAKVKPRRLVEEVPVRELPESDIDAVLVRVTMAGKRDGLRTRITYQIVEQANAELGLSAMMRATAFPAAVVAWMIGAGHAKGPGALPQEKCLPPKMFIDELRKRGLAIDIAEHSERPL